MSVASRVLLEACIHATGILDGSYTLSLLYRGLGVSALRLGHA